MSLGSIAHMQYYFARTGLLDGKGGHLAKKRAKSLEENDSPALTLVDKENLSPSAEQSIYMLEDVKTDSQESLSLIHI